MIGGWRNKVYRTPKADRSKWKKCANEGGYCNPNNGGKNYIMRFGAPGKGWTSWKGKGREKCTTGPRWGVRAVNTGNKSKVCQWKPF